MRLRHIRSVSGKGQRPEDFQVRLAGIAVDATNRLLAVGDRAVKRFSASGELDVQFATRDAGWSIAVDEDAIWVGMEGTIDRFDARGAWQDRIQDPDHLGRITGLAVKGDVVLAADATHRTIHQYGAGEWQREVGRDVNTRGFMLPNGVLDLAWDVSQTSFVVAHPQKHRVERYNLEGALTQTFGRFGMDDPADFGGCCNPTNITATAGGLIVVSEKAPPRVKVYTGDGQFVSQSSAAVFAANTKNIDLAADQHGQVYATDPVRCTIEVFELDAGNH